METAGTFDTGGRLLSPAVGSALSPRALGVIVTDDRDLVCGFSAGLAELGLDDSPKRVGRHWTEVFPRFRRLPASIGGSDDDFVVVIESTRQTLRVTRCAAGCRQEGRGRWFLILRPFEPGERGEAWHLTTLGELAAGVAHEINNPLTTISGWVQIFSSEATEEDPFHEQLGSIQEELDRIAEIVNRLLAFAQRPGAGSELVSVNDLLRSMAAFVDYQMRTASVRVETRLSPQIPMVQGKTGELKEVFLNLMTNSRQAMPGGGTLRLTTGLSVDGRWVEIRFQDRGHGVSPEARDRIFESHFTTRAAEGGSGLGLSLSRDLVQGMGGQLQLESTSKGGSTFLVRLPGADEGSVTYSAMDGAPSASAGESKPW